MIQLSIPGHGDFRLAHAAFDLNGKLARGGHRIDGTADRLQALQQHLTALGLILDRRQPVATFRR